jgi:hypothetical protein
VDGLGAARTRERVIGPLRRRGTGRRRVLAVVAGATLAAAVLALAWHDVTRQGYAPDEEFTVFAVRGIAAHGLPLLPSRLLYDRGVAYSYTAWLATMTGGAELPAARAVSLATGLLALAVTWLGVRQVSGRYAAWLAVLLVGPSLPFWVAATSARFYAPFLALHLAALALLSQVDREARGGVPWRLAALFGVAAVARLTHELAFLLAAVPLVAFLLASGRRSRWLAAAVAILAGLAAAQLGLFGLHYLAPESGATMIRRFFLWQVLNLLERPPAAAPLGVLIVGGLAWLLVRGRLPRAEGRATRLIALGAALAVLVWAAATSPWLSLHYPLDLFWHVGHTMPALAVVLGALLGARALGLGGAWAPHERALHLLWLGWVTFFGVIESGITIHYVLVPVTLMLVAIAVDLAAVLQPRASHVGVGARPMVAARHVTAAALVFVVTLAQWGWSPADTLARARPTLIAPAAVAQWAAEAPLVACTDELACLLLAGRVDRWLALDDFVRERFVVRLAGVDAGVYAGRPAVYSLAALFDDEPGAAAPVRVMVVDVSKDLAVGPSSAFLERALASEPVQARELLDEGKIRVVELSLP